MRLGQAATLLLLLATLSMPRNAEASPIKLDEPDPANYLQGGPGASEQGLIQQALTMPAVVKAMQVFASRGYVHEVSTDRAGWSDSKIEVALGYSIPGHPDVGGVI